MALVEGFPALDKDWLEGVLRKSEKLPASVELSSASPERVGADKGFLSIVSRVALTWTGLEKENAPASVILKVPVASGMESLSDQMGAPQEAFKTDKETGESGFDFVYQVHETECRFYEFCKAKGQPFKTPKAYFTQKHTAEQTGVLVLEDVGAKGCVPHMSFPLNKAQLTQVFNEVARFHAYSLSHPEFFGIQQPQEMDIEGMNSFVGFVKGVLNTLKQQQPDMFGDLVDKALPWVTTDNFLGSFTYFMKSGMRPVMIHGDLWNNNFFFNNAEDADGKPHHGDSLVSIIDFQMCRSGLPGDDLAHVLLSSVENDLWAEDLRGVLDETYYQPLLAALPEGSPAPFSLDDVIRQIEDTSLPNVLQGMATGSSQLPGLLQDPDPAAKQRLGKMMARMRANLAWALPHFKAFDPPTEEEMKELMASLSVSN